MIGFEREDEDIVRYYNRVQPHDAFGIWGTELLLRLPLAKAEPYMKADHGWTPEAWEKARMKKDHESILAEIEDYFQFATEKAIAHRGNSASRSVHHYLAWTWLTHDLDLFGYLMDDRNYPNYGCPMLLAVAQQYDLLDLLPTNHTDHYVFMNMAQGRQCSDLCAGGCGQGRPGVYRALTLPVPVPPNGKTTNLILPK